MSEPTSHNTDPADCVWPTLDEHIRRLVDAAPPLGAEQRDRLVVLLRSPTTTTNGDRAAA